MNLDDESLCVTVSIPSYEMVGDVVMYDVLLLSRTITWRIQRRYQEFYDLHMKLSCIEKDLPHFTGKHRFRSFMGASKDIDFIAKRQARLAVGDSPCVRKWTRVTHTGGGDHRNICSRSGEFNIHTNQTKCSSQWYVRGNALGAVLEAQWHGCLALRGKAFGIPLEDFAVLVDSESEVPYIVEQCCSFIFQCGLRTEGIFRIMPDLSLVEKAQRLFDEGDDVDFSTYPNGVHVAAQVLYNFIRSLPSAILPMEQCSIVHNISANDLIARVETLTSICRRMSKIGFACLRDIVCLIGLLVDNYEFTQMDLPSLVAKFAPILIQPPGHRRELDPCAEDVMVLLIHHRQRVFLS